MTATNELDLSHAALCCKRLPHIFKITDFNRPDRCGYLLECMTCHAKAEAPSTKKVVEAWNRKVLVFVPVEDNVI